MSVKASSTSSAKEGSARGLTYEQLQMLRKCIFDEEDSRLFFDKVAARMNDENLRKEFAQIAADSKRHVQQLMEIYHGEFETGELPSIGPDVIHLLQHHLQSEEDVDKFYEEMAKNRNLDEKTRLAFLSISADEKSHHARILSLIQMLEESKEKER